MSSQLAYHSNSIASFIFNYPVIKNPDFKTLTFHIEKAWIEVQNGLEATLIACDTNPQESEKLLLATQEVIRSLKTKAYQWCVDSFCCQINNKIFICTFKSLNTYEYSNPHINASSSLSAYHALSTIEKAKILYSLLCHPFSEEEKAPLRSLLRTEAAGNTRVLATLAAEILLVWGEPTLPNKFIYTEDNSCITKNQYNANMSQLFEDRIDVHAYNYFELTHPSYARQCVALANYALKTAHAKQLAGHTCLDIGTGPGAALLMQNELMPDYQFMAIEPSLVAYNHLLANIATHSNINALHVDYLHYETQHKFHTILSTGASHHLNTFSFMQKSSSLLDKNGIFIIADEMISPYSTNTQRKLNVMTHHSVYILELLKRLAAIDKSTFNDQEKNLADLLTNMIPLAFTLAKLSFLNEAEQLYKQLLSDLNKLTLNIHSSSPFVAFYRLMYLELEALVAGIDYEVEQKTYPESLINLGRLANLECVYHECVHNTSGIDKMHSGTHVFAFQHRK